MLLLIFCELDSKVVSIQNTKLLPKTNSTQLDAFPQTNCQLFRYQNPQKSSASEIRAKSRATVSQASNFDAVKTWTGLVHTVRPVSGTVHLTSPSVDIRGIRRGGGVAWSHGGSGRLPSSAADRIHSYRRWSMWNDEIWCQAPSPNADQLLMPSNLLIVE